MCLKSKIDSTGLLRIFSFLFSSSVRLFAPRTVYYQRLVPALDCRASEGAEKSLQGDTFNDQIFAPFL